MGNLQYSAHRLKLTRALRPAAEIFRRFETGGENKVDGL